MFVGRSSPNHYRKARNTTITWRVASTRATTRSSTIVSLQEQGLSTQGIVREPKIGLPMKFDGARSQFRGFLNQVRPVIQIHPSQYPSDASRVGLAGTCMGQDSNLVPPCKQTPTLPL